MNTSELNLPCILLVEDDPALLDFTCPETGFLLWPLIRLQFLRFILSDTFYGQSLVQISRPHTSSQAVSSLGKAILHNFYRGSSLQSDVMLMGTGLGLYQKDGAWFNRLTDHFVAAHPETIAIEDFFEWRWPFPRKNPRVLFHAQIQAYASIAGKLHVRKKHLAVATALVALVRERARSILNWELGDERATYLRNVLAHHTAAIPIKRGAYRKLLSQAETRLLIKEEGCYGPSSVIIATAKEMSIVTAEYQHGSVSAGNDAYNLAQRLIGNSEYRKTLPDYFLGYGEWWNEQINVPVKKLVIGNPHRSEQLLTLHTATQMKKRDLLILGDGIDTQAYLHLARTMAARLGSELEVVFRPHPLEREWIKANFPKGRIDAIRVDINQDIYQSFATAYAVVSEVSTGLFEAVGLAERIFIWNTSKSRFCYPAHPFESFANIEELAELIKSLPREITVVPEKIWAPNWRTNYLEFLQTVQTKPDRESL